MDAQTLTDQILARDYTVILAVRKAGASVEPTLSHLATHADPGVRELALACLVETAGPQALGAFITALLDTDAVVRAAAMRGLRARLASVTEQVGATLLDVYDRSGDPVVRREIALVLVESPAAGPAIGAELKARWQREGAPPADLGCVVALARLGDPDARDAFLARLRGTSGRARAALLDDARIIHAPWLLRPLGALLDDLSPALRIGADGDPTVPEYLRVVDLAVVLIASISGERFSFTVDRQTNFSAPQVAEVRAFVDRLP